MNKPTLINPDFFPDGKTHFLIDGPAGALELMTTTPKEDLQKGVGIMCHPHPLYDGSMTNKVVHTVLRAFDSFGLKTVRFNFRGVGFSEGAFADAKGETDDLFRVIEWVQARDLGPIWLGGFSFGAFVAASGANQIEVKQLITVAPVVTSYDFDSLTKIAAPWLIVQGAEDELIDSKKVFDWAEALKNKRTSPVEFVLLPETSHFFHGKLIDLRHVVESHLVA